MANKKSSASAYSWKATTPTTSIAALFGTPGAEEGNLRKKVVLKKTGEPYRFVLQNGSSAGKEGIIKTVQSKDDSLTESFKAKMFEVLQCPICHEGVKSTHLCPKCQQHFCHDCISDWLVAHVSCPNCRANLTAKELVKYVRFDELQQTIRQFRLPEFCRQHDGQQVSLFCYPCEACICVSCCFSELHIEHKEQVVPLDHAFQHYKQTLGGTLFWLNSRKAEISEALDQSQKNGQLLAEEQNHFVQLYGQSAKLISGEADVATVRRMLELEKSIADARQQSESRKLPMPSCCEDYFVPDPVTLVFRFLDLAGAGTLETAPQLSYGFIWGCQIVKEIDQFCCYLKLIHGKSSRYAIAIKGQREKFVYVDVGKPLSLGVVNVDEAADDTYEVMVRIRQTYGDRCQQLQVYVAHLEKENGQNETFKQQFDEWWKKGVPMFK